MTILNIRRKISLVLMVVTAYLIASEATFLFAQEASDFFWCPVQSENADENNTCFFRKKFQLVGPEQSQILVAATGDFTVYINGKLAVKGSASEEYQTYETTQFVYAGTNLVAVKLSCPDTEDNGIAIRFRVKERQDTRWRALTLDDSWLTHHRTFENWNKHSFQDLSWLPATATIQLPRTQPEDIQNKISATESQTSPSVPITNPVEIIRAKQASTSGDESKNVTQVPTAKLSREAPTSPVDTVTDSQASAKNEDNQPGPADTASTEPQFEISEEFNVNQVMSGEETGSIIAMAFDEFGRMIFSQEGGKLMIADLSIPFGTVRVARLCEQVENCQGILPINGRLYVTGKGPNGLGLYVLDRSSTKASTMKVSKCLLRFQGEMGEHGPHGLVLGPDGCIYCVLGNATGIESSVITGGSYRHPYDVDMRPRYEDPSGHANGIKAPGGTIVRISLDGSVIETVAGGIRNAYDLVFNQKDDLFIHDSDMESDVGLPWYRPTSLYHITEGIDVGWRSGWAKFPDYYLDTVVPVAKTGRGSPSGAICYDHIQFPVRYHGALFLADWSEGRILAVTQIQDGASYKTEVEEFLKGKPLNVTDIDVGEDGAIYFSTGGRGTSGGIYRVSWKGTIPDSVATFEDELVKVVRHPQPSSAWAHQNTATIMATKDHDWKTDLELVAKDKTNTSVIRCRALETLYLYGHLADQSLLRQLSKDNDEQVRSKICYLSGCSRDWSELCLDMLDDESDFVKRRALEALLRSGRAVPLDRLLPFLQSSDHVLASTACRLLERIPVANWKPTIMASENNTEFLMGALALLRVEPKLENSYDLLVRCSEMMDGFLNDHDFMGMLRIMQLALGRADVDPEKIQGFTDKMVQEFPTSDAILNRELIRILAYLQATDVQSSVRNYLESHEDDLESKILVAMYMASIADKLDDETRLALIGFLHTAGKANDGGSYQIYLARCIRQATEALSKDAITTVLKNGDQWPYALVPVFYRLGPEDLSEKASELCDLDRRLASHASRDVVAQSRLGIIALLAEGKTEIGAKYLRDLWTSEANRRNDIVVGIAQIPSNENWAFLIASLPIMDDMTANEVLPKIFQIKLRPVDAKHYRQLLELGYRIRNEGAIEVAKIMKLWSKEDVQTTGTDWKSQLDSWTEWYQTRWPDEKPVKKDVITGGSTDSYQDTSLIDALQLGELKGDPEQGLIVFSKVGCIKCHRFGANGDSSGPDLTSLASRFSKRETFESIVFPSKVVPDQYQSTMVVNDHGVTFVGLKIENGDGSLSLMQSNGQRIRLDKSEIVEMKKVSQSSMPEDLLSKLTKQEIGDLFAFLYNEKSDATASKPSSNSILK